MIGKKAKTKIILSMFLTMVILVSSIYFILNDSTRVDIQETKSIFKIQIDGKWVVTGIEYTNIFDGSAKMRASERTIQTDTYLNDTIVTRTAQYKNGILVVEKYLFQSNVSDVSLFPVSHSIEVIGAKRDRPYILQYEVQKLLYTGETTSGIESPQSFGHKMEVEWESGNYYSKIYKYLNKDEGKLTVKYKIDSDRFQKNIRLFDPPGSDLIVSSNTELCGLQEYDNVIINNSATVTVCAYNGTDGTGELNFSVSNKFTLESGSTITGDGKGSRGGYYVSNNHVAAEGTGKGNPNGGGGGYGATGGNSGYEGAGSPVGSGGSSYNGNSEYNISIGSGGAGGDYKDYTNGAGGGTSGALISIIANNISTRGTITSDGNVGGNIGGNYAGWGGGGASGGGILLEAPFVDISSSTFTSTGGTGGDNGGASGIQCGGGGGAGGRIKIFYNSVSNSSFTSTLTGGAGGSNNANCNDGSPTAGGTGTIHYEVIEFPPVTSPAIEIDNNFTNNSMALYCNSSNPLELNVSYSWKIYIDDVLNISNSSTQNYTDSELVNLQNISANYFSHNNTVKLSCLATDGVSNSSWANDSVKVNQPVWINITNPTQNQIVQDLEHNITYSFENYTNYDSCWYTNDSGVTNQSITCGNVIGPYNWSDGDNTVIIYSNSSAGDDFSDTVTFTTVPDPPQVKYWGDTPLNGSWVNTITFDVELHIVDDSAFSNSTFRLYNTSLANTTTFATLVTATSGLVWNTSLYGGDGNYSFNTTTYSIFGETNSTDTRQIYVDTIYPLIEYSSNSDTSNSSGDFTSKDWVWINVSITETNIANVTFWTWTSLNNLFNKTVFTNSASYYTMNQTGLSEDVYFWNVTICDYANNCNTTSERYYGTEEVNLSIDSFYSNQEVELGGDINLSATSTYDYVFIDVDHPSYGTNYSSGKWTTTLELLIDWFQKTSFYSGTSEYLNFTSGFGTDENKTFNLTAHQHDEIISVGLNMSGTNEPKDVAFYKANSTDYDRIFYGNLTGDYIHENRLIDKSGTSWEHTETQNVSWENEGSKYLYFYLDSGSKLVNFLLNVSSISSGFSFTDTFTTNIYVDDILTNASYNGFIRPGFTETSEFTYDNFSSPTINTTKWTTSITGSAYGYDSSSTSSISGGALYSDVTLAVQACCGVDDCDGDRNIYQLSNTTEINLYAVDGVSFELDFLSDYRETSDDTIKSNAHCDENSKIHIGNTVVWEPYDYGCTTPSGGTCDVDITTPETLNFNLTRQIQNTWNVKISGSEKSISFRDDTCGDYTIINNWTTGVRSYVFENCADYNSDIDNDFNITVSPDQYVLYILTSIDTNYEDPECYGCHDMESWTKLDNVNYVLPNYLNNTEYISDSIFDSSYNVPSVDPTMLYYTYSLFPENGATVTFFVSGDNGDNWQNFISGVDTPITNTGKYLKWKTTIDLATDGYTMDIPVIYSSSFQTQQSNLSNITFDFGEDGIVDYTINGEFGPGNGTVQVDLSTADISSIFTGVSSIAQTYDVSLIVNSDSAGTLSVEWINLTSDPNPVYLNSTAIQNYLTSFGSGDTTIPIVIESSGNNSIVNLTDLEFDYAGGNDTIEITAHNNDSSLTVARNVTFYYSYWDYSWVPENVEWIYFSPRTPDEQNVTPYGQTLDIPLLNVTNYGYGGKNADLSIYANDSLSCVDMYVSTSTKPLSSLWDGLVGHWTFDFQNQTDTDIVEDIAGSNNGVLSGATWNSSGGQLGGAYEFDGVDDLVNVSFSEDLNITDEITISAWVKFQNNTAYERIVAKSHTINANPYTMYGIVRVGGTNHPTEVNGQIRLELAQNGAQHIVHTTSSPSIGDWFHIVGTYNGSDMSLYYNGSIETSGQQIYDGTNGTYVNMSGDLDYNSMPLIFGSDGLDGNFFNGSIDDIRIYNRTLTPAEITEIYTRSYAKYYDVKLTEGWRLIDANKDYLDDTSLFFYTDYDCDYSNWRLFNPYITLRQTCENCLASEEVV